MSSPRRRSRLTVSQGLVLTLGLAAWSMPVWAQVPIASHPSGLTFDSLEFEPPVADEYRHTLSNGVVVFVVEDHTLPLVNVGVTIRTGSYLEPPGKTGVAGLTGGQLRAGGTAKFTASEFDDEVAFLAAQIGSSIGGTSGSARFNCLTKDLNVTLELFFGMLRHPRFEQARLDLAKRRSLQGMQRRNDSTAGIERREWARLMRGEHFSTEPTTRQSIESITREDLIAFHRRYYHPGGFIFAVSGDVTPEEILPELEAWMADWPAETASVPPVPVPSDAPSPGIYLVDKADVNQGRVAIGHLGTGRDNPNRHALIIMNDILGGGGFSSRLMSRIRSDEGLAYSVYTRFGLGTYYDGVFRTGFQSRSETVARASSIVIEEIERIRSEPVSEAELRISKTSFIETFTRNFSSTSSTASLFVANEYTGRDSEYLARYRDRINAVSGDDVLRVAREYLKPNELVILVVGDLSTIEQGDPDNPEYSLDSLSDGPITRIPLPDPYTMEYPAQP